MREQRFRMRRVNEALKEVLGQTIQSGLKDPRIGFVTVTAVQTTPDLRHARVFVSVLGDEKAKEQSLAGLHSAEGHLQGVLNRELHLKRIPALEFVYDPSIDEGMKIQALLRSQEKALGVDLSAPAGEEPEGDGAVEHEDDDSTRRAEHQPEAGPASQGGE